MRKPSKLEETYHLLERMDAGSLSGTDVAVIRSAITGSSGLIIARAAELVGAGGLRELIQSTVEAFARLMPGGAKSDKNCAAKTAIADALNHLEYLGDEVFVAGARYVQMEPVFGGSVDTAIPLRRACAYGLARIGHPDAHYMLADLLVDADPSVRGAAAKALGCMGTPEGEVMLRLRVLTGEKEAEVLGECFASLLAMAPSRSMDFVTRYLDSRDLPVFECAALAVGQSRSPRAFGVLRDCWEAEFDSHARSALVLPIALVRTDDAFEFLLDVVRRGSSDIASEAVAALSLYADDASVRAVYEVVNAKGNAQVTRAFESKF